MTTPATDAGACLDDRGPALGLGDEHVDPRSPCTPTARVPATGTSETRVLSCNTQLLSDSIHYSGGPRCAFLPSLSSGLGRVRLFRRSTRRSSGSRTEIRSPSTMAASRHESGWMESTAPRLARTSPRGAKQFTSEIVFGKQVRIEGKETDRYGRLVARIKVGGTDVSLALVEAGLAWHYKQYSDDQVLAAAEVVAKAKKIGVWSLPNPVPPWITGRE